MAVAVVEGFMEQMLGGVSGPFVVYAQLEMNIKKITTEKLFVN